MFRLLSLGALAFVAACAGPTREPFTLAEQLGAAVPGIPEARVWGDAGPATLAGLGMSPAQVAARRPGPLNYLALSSGGPAGAYGAGLLVGWTEAGTRPEFDVVTGVSSGALIAPFAFVGPGADGTLRELWEGDLAQSLGEGQNLLGLLTGTGVLDPAPLRALIDTYVSDGLVAAIAVEHAKGRRLLVMTTNLDAQRPVIWNLGAIAASGRPGAADLVRQILVASASIPVAYPPVLVDMVAGTRTIQEMHVDGGVSSQIFALPEAVLAGEETFAVPDGREATLWLVVTHVLGPEYGVTPGGSFGIGTRAYGTLIKAELRNELCALAGAAREAGLGLHLSSIPQSVPWDPRDPFAASFMRTLFELGRRDALAGTSQGLDAGGRS